MNSEINQLIENGKSKLAVCREEEKVASEIREAEIAQARDASERDAIKIVMDAMALPEAFRDLLTLEEISVGEYAKDDVVTLTVEGCVPIHVALTSKSDPLGGNEWTKVWTGVHEKAWVIARCEIEHGYDNKYVRTVRNKRYSLKQEPRLELALAIATENFSEGDRMKVELAAETAQRASFKSSLIAEPTTEEQLMNLLKQFIAEQTDGA